MTLKDTIELKLAEAFRPLHLEVVNESGNHNVPAGSETHFKVVVVGRIRGPAPHRSSPRGERGASVRTSGWRARPRCAYVYRARVARAVWRGPAVAAVPGR